LVFRDEEEFPTINMTSTASVNSRATPFMFPPDQKITFADVLPKIDDGLLYQAHPGEFPIIAYHRDGAPSIKAGPKQVTSGEICVIATIATGIDAS
jgi:hypothetical protein